MLVMEDRRKEVKAILCEELDNLRQRIIENHIRAGQRASGKTIKSLHVVVDDNHGTLYGRQAFGVLEVGRASGKVPKGFYKIHHLPGCFLCGYSAGCRSKPHLYHPA